MWKNIFFYVISLDFYNITREFKNLPENYINFISVVSSFWQKFQKTGNPDSV